MIKIEDVEIIGIGKAIISMRNSMDSENKSDSTKCDLRCVTSSYCNYSCPFENITAGYTHIGEEDMKLCKRLIKTGSFDRKFLRTIHVQADVIAPIYFLNELDFYQVIPVENYYSVRKRLCDKEFTLNDFSREHLDELPTLALPKSGFQFDRVLEDVVDALNDARKMYLETKDKAYWWQIIRLLPSSYNQRCTIDLNYEKLISIYYQNRDHKLDEWVEFCEWIETLPYMKEFLGLDEESETEE